MREHRVEEDGQCWCEPETVQVEAVPVDLDQPADEAAEMRQFETGATRNKEVDPDIYGFTSPLALHAFAAYMHANRLQADGTMRDSDNWKKGIPQDSYIRSMRRHLQDLTLHWDGYPELAREDMFAAACGLFFNVQGFIHEAVKADIEFSRQISDAVAAAIASREEGTEEKTDEA